MGPAGLGPAAGSQWGQTGQQGWGQPGSQWAPTLPSAWDQPDPWATDSYPVDVRFTPDARIGRYWGIPVIGHAVRALALIPHFIVLLFFSIVVAFGALFTWIPVLILGRQAGWAYTILGGSIRWAIRVQTWFQMLSGTYPPFTTAEGDGQHVRVRIDEDQRINRFWGIPILGFLVRYIILIPHILILWILGIIVWFLLWFAWIPVLIYGRQADLIYTLVGGFVRWQTRVSAYLLLLSGQYPPFRLD
jgi:hypothetical protein